MEPFPAPKNYDIQVKYNIREKMAYKSTLIIQYLIICKIHELKVSSQNGEYLKEALFYWVANALIKFSEVNGSPIYQF